MNAKKFFTSPLGLLIASATLFGLASHLGHNYINIVLVIAATGLFAAALIRQHQADRKRKKSQS